MPEREFIFVTPPRPQFERAVARQIGEWLYMRCGADAAMVDQLLMTFRSEYAQARATMAECLGEPG